MTHKLGVVEDTLYVPMVGRIYAGEHCPKVLYDQKALALKEVLPEGLYENSIGRQAEYNLIASASRSANFDRYIKNFLKRKPNGVIVELGCGLETTYDRNDNGHTKWYALDLENVIEYRHELLPMPERQSYLGMDAFSKDWIELVRKEQGDAPILILASGLFYYFEEDTVLGLFRMLHEYGDIEVLFDSVNGSGMKRMQNKYMKEVGHADAKVYFYVDDAQELVQKIGTGASVLAEEKYYQHIDCSQVKLMTRITMNVSDLLKMVKMVHLQL